MNKFIQKLSELSAKGKLAASDINDLKAAFSELSADDQNNLRLKA